MKDIPIKKINLKIMNEMIRSVKTAQKKEGLFSQARLEISGGAAIEILNLAKIGFKSSKAKK